MSARLPVVIERTAPTSGLQYIPFSINTKLAYISNDSSTYDLIVNFDKPTDQSGSFTIKPGEVVSDIPMACVSISVQGIGGIVPFRCMGV